MKSVGIIASPPPAALIFLLSEIESAALCASAVRVGCKSGLWAGSRPGEKKKRGGDIYQKIVRNRAARVFLCKYSDSFASGHVISHFNAPFLPRLKIDGKFKHVSSRRSRGGAARPGHTSLSCQLHPCLLMRASQSAILWQEQICHPNIDAISAEVNALGLIPTCNLSQKHDMTEETEQLRPTTADWVDRSFCRAPLESDSRPPGSDVWITEPNVIMINQKPFHLIPI